MGHFAELYLGQNSFETGIQNESELQEIVRNQEDEVLFAETALNSLVYSLWNGKLDGPILPVEEKNVFIFEQHILNQLTTDFKKTVNSPNRHVLPATTMTYSQGLPTMDMDFFLSRYTVKDAEKNPHWNANLVNYRAIYYTFHPELQNDKVQLFFGITHWRASPNNLKNSAHIQNMQKTLRILYPGSVYHPNSFDGGILLEGPIKQNISMDEYVKRYNLALKKTKRNLY